MSSLVGRKVIVENPANGSMWTGRAVAYVDHPSYVVQQEDGSRVTLPAAWAREGEIVTMSESEYELGKLMRDRLTSDNERRLNVLGKMLG